MAVLFALVFALVAASLVIIAVRSEIQRSKLAPSFGGPSGPHGTNFAESLASGGDHLLEAQDEFLKVLLRNPSDHEAMRGLVALRRRMAGDDLITLRRQAATYQQAINQGTETEEHYTINVMEFLVAATLQAASEIENARSRRSTGAAPALGPEELVASDPGAAPTQQTKTSTVISSTPTRTAPVPDTSPNANDASYVVRVGPVSESNAAEIFRQLGIAHYASRMEGGQTEPERFRVVSGPMKRSDAGQLASTLAQRHIPSLVRSLPDGQVEVQFGVFTSQAYAQDLASRIQGQGFMPAVIREGAVRIITLGPYSEASVKAIVKTIESTLPYRSLTTAPCDSKDPLIHAWRGWVQVCKVSPR